jgi:ElaB/YqjD/DUF883 family membrane-anchored ribosome-binding protein
MSKGHDKGTVADATEPVVIGMASGAHDAVDKAAGAAAHAAKAVDEKGGQLRELQVEWLDKSRAYVRDNPVKALGIAVVGGFLLSRLLSSR